MRSDGPTRPEPEETPAVSIRYSIPKILRVRNSLAEVLRIEYAGRRIVGAEFERFVDVVDEGLEVRGLDRKTLVDSLRWMAGIPLDAQLLHDAAHRLAGNVHRLKRRRPVVPWQVQRFPEWVPIQLIAARPDRRNDRDPGATYTAKVLAGLACPRLVPVWWSLKQIRYMAPMFGFSRPLRPDSRRRAPYPFASPAQLVSMRLEGLVDPKLSDREPAFAKFRFAPALDQWNRQKVKQRCRVDPGYGCPLGYPATFPCHHCAVGYERCPAATHRKSYELRPCTVCDAAEAAFDPDQPGAACVDCTARAAYRRPKKGG